MGSGTFQYSTAVVWSASCRLNDLNAVETVPIAAPSQMRVEEAMSTDVYAVPPGTPLREVASTMAARKLGSAVVMEDSRVVGMFTTVDALDTLAVVLTQDVPGRVGP